ncbi:MAG: hypothetical protein ACPL6C_01815 [bacterium]
MKRLVMLIVFLPTVIFAGKVSVGGNFSVYDPPGDAGPTIMIGVSLGVRFNDYFEGACNIDWTQYKEGGKDVTLIPITIDIISHPLGIKLFDPFIGGGIGYYYKLVGNENQSTLGAQFKFGIHWKPTTGTGLDFTVTYRVPDIINHPNDGGWSLGGGASGTVGTSFTVGF